jgi:aminopeptidase N
MTSRHDRNIPPARRRNAPTGKRARPRTALTRWLLVGCLAAAAVCAGPPATAQEATAGPPPPLPSPEDRVRFIAWEQEALPVPIEPGAPPRAVHDAYDVDHYDIDLALDIPAQVLTGTVVVHATAQEAGLAEVDLDLYACMRVDAVTAGGNPASFTHANDILTITLDGIYQPGEAFTVAATFHGTPNFPGNPLPFRWMQHATTPMVLSYSEPFGAPAWWLCKDDPKDKATYATAITCPDDLTAVSNGFLTQVVDNGNGTKTYHWSTDYPMSPYLFSIAVTNFASWTEVYTALDGVTTMDVDYYAYPEDLTRAQVSWSNNIAMIEYYATLFGEYPFLDEKYAIAEFQHPGAMEHQTATSMGFSWITGTHTYDWVVAHELSHSWVGDMITMTEWSHAWCKEGFATICEALYFEHLYGLTYYHSYMNGMGVLSYAPLQLYNIQPVLHGAIYYKGAWVLHMLRHVIGDAAFFAGVYGYANDPALMYADGDTEDLRAAFEAAAGMDLAWFFDQWIYHPGYPIYQYVWWPEPAGGGYDVMLTLRQVQTTGPLFKMPVDARVTTALGSQTFVAWDSLQTQTFAFHVDSEPLGLMLDPDSWIIRTLQIMSGVDPAPPTAELLLHPQPNPFRGETRIVFDLPQPERVAVTIHDAAGRRVATLLDAALPAGRAGVAWNGTDKLGRSLPPGRYFSRVTAGGQTVAGSLLLMR